MKMEIGKLSEQAIENLKKLENEVDDIANDMNFTGNLIMSSKTETNKTETE